MCGVCGIVSADGAREDVLGPIASRMTALLAHRGPDDRGVATAGETALGHTRLSVIDLSACGHQPMRSQDGRLTLVYNGEVYNYDALRRELVDLGTQFRSRSDTEVVLEAYRHWGTTAFRRLNGMFALAIWDASVHELVLARDRFGVKPLYLSTGPWGLAFASEIKALLAHPSVSRDVDWQAMSEYLWFGNALGSRTAFAAVSRLSPGHYARYRDGQLDVGAFWRLEDVPQQRVDRESAARRVRKGLADAVTAHLVSDVPVGVMLSGGIDSSAITAFAAGQLGRDLRTFAIGFDVPGVPNELAKAAAVARHFGTTHAELHVGAAALPATIEALVNAHDEPFADAANIPLFLACRELTGKIKVLLQGDGGDEMFGGYRRYRLLSSERVWHAAGRIARAPVHAFIRGRLGDRARRFVDALAESDRAVRTALLLTTERKGAPPEDVLSAAARRELASADPFREYRHQYERFAHLDPAQRAIYTDLSVLLPNTFLEKVDKSTMAHGVEVRVPFLDVDLAAFAVGLPASLKAGPGGKKLILRAALRGVVPDAVLDAPKTGFGVPFSEWLRRPLAPYLRERVLDPETRRWGLFDQPALEQAIDDHVTGRRNRGFLLWKCLHLALWHRRYLNS